MDLQPLREQIDVLDRQIVEILNKRLALAAEIGKLKRGSGGQIYVAEREDAVLRKVTGFNQGPIKNEALRAIYCEIMSAAIALEKWSGSSATGYGVNVATLSGADGQVTRYAAGCCSVSE